MFFLCEKVLKHLGIIQVKKLIQFHRWKLSLVMICFIKLMQIKV